MAHIALTIAGSDPSGGAGIQADLKTFCAMGAYGAAVIVALTAQNTRGVYAVHAPPPEFVRQQLEAVFDDLEVAAAKVGMLGMSATTVVVAEFLSRFPNLPLVVDPVMVASSGDSLLEPDAEQTLRERILPMASLITPNIPEAARLLRTAEASDEAALRKQAVALLDLGPRAVLLKGGHREGASATDYFATREGVVTLGAPRIATRNTHGTGCTLSAAIAAGLALGHPLAEAVREAKSFVTEAIRLGALLNVGRGNGPLDHAMAARRWHAGADHGDA